MVGPLSVVKALKTSAKMGKAALKGDKEQLSRVANEELPGWGRYIQRKVQSTAAEPQSDQPSEESDATSADHSTTTVETSGGEPSFESGDGQGVDFSNGVNYDGNTDYTQYDLSGNGTLDSLTQDTDGGGFFDAVGSLFDALLA
ncbi:hypothetical protein FGB62_84g08 [Gracilaria domingensis]|nr:hypothetical protein FGB62_84g03 [Gracilaria domingensis]KAI0561396.1 hypothetical protein FGB62_84g08 [Gracilaria domingensis]